MAMTKSNDPDAAMHEINDKTVLQQHSSGMEVLCYDTLKRLEARLLPEKRTEHEIFILRKANGGTNPSQYNYSRLYPIAIANLFYPIGSWSVHCKCASKFLRLPPNWFTRVHHRFIDLAEVPTIPVLRSSVDSRDERVLARVVMPQDSSLTVSQYLSSMSPAASFSNLLAEASYHRLSGFKGNEV